MRMPRTNTKTPFVLSVSILLVAAGAMGGVVYASIALFPFVSGPSLSVGVAENENLGTSVISGDTNRVSRVTVNDLAVPISESGAFSVERAFPLGYTVVVVRAEDRFGRERKEILTLITKKHEGPYVSKEETDRKENQTDSAGVEYEQDRLN